MDPVKTNIVSGHIVIEPLVIEGSFLFFIGSDECFGLPHSSFDDYLIRTLERDFGVKYHITQSMQNFEVRHHIWCTWLETAEQSQGCLKYKQSILGLSASFDQLRATSAKI